MLRTPPLPLDETAPMVMALLRFKDMLTTHALHRWHDPAALECYDLVDAALAVAIQVLAGDLAPSRNLAVALDAALRDETRLPWAPALAMCA